MRFLKGLLLALGLATVPAQAAAPWREASSTHFVIYSQDSEAGLRRFAERLERFDKALRVMRKVDDAPMGAANRLTVFVVSDATSVRRLLGEGPRAAVGFYSGRAGNSLAFTPLRIGSSDSLDLNAQIVLLHEYTHHFMWRYFPAAYPAWFVEGFAEFNATARFTADGGVGIGYPAGHRAWDLVTDTGALPLSAMLGDTRPKLGDAELAALYSRGWLLTHYLTFSETRRGQLGAYLNAINKGVPAAQAATEAFGRIDVLDRELRAHMRKARLPYLPFRPEELPIGPVSVRLTSPGMNAMLPVVMRSRRGVNKETAPEVAAEARAAAAPYPNDAFVQAALAEAEYDAGQLDAAEQAADRAIAADPKSSRGLLYKAAVAMARAEKVEGAARLALIRQARPLITRANRLDPDDPTPLMLFYTSFKEAGEKPTANAVTGLTVAHQLAPEDDSLRLTLARQLVEDKRIAEVRILLAPLANAPHRGGWREAAQTILAGLPASAPAAPADAAEAAPATP